MVVAGGSVSGDNHEPRESDPAEAESLDRSDELELDATESQFDSKNPRDILVESQVGRIPNELDPSSQAIDVNDARFLQLFQRIQVLEREYISLQGRIEELEHLYQEERHTNRRRFLDMDRRLREQMGSQLAPEDILTEADLNTEIGLYRRAMAFVDAEDYQEALALFQQLVDLYPNGQKVPDAMYWLAEIYRNIEPINLEKSRQFFVQMVTLYSDHARIPEALAKLGMIYHSLGNETRALEYLDRVIAEFPDHDAARLAETYAQELR